MYVTISCFDVVLLGVIIHILMSQDFTAYISYNVLHVYHHPCIKLSNCTNASQSHSCIKCHYVQVHHELDAKHGVRTW